VPSPDLTSLPPQGTKAAIQLGLRANWQQFTLLVIVNAFVGGMVGLERSIVPLLGQRAFGLASTTAVLSFIMSFGVVKALANLFAGRLSDHIGRKGCWWLAGSSGCPCRSSSSSPPPGPGSSSPMSCWASTRASVGPLP